MTIYIDKTQKQCYSRRIRYDNRLTHKKGEQNEEKNSSNGTGSINGILYDCMWKWQYPEGR